MYYIGLDVHKKVIVYYCQDADGRYVDQGRLSATRSEIQRWVASVPRPVHCGMEATQFSAWIHDTLYPLVDRVVVGHSARLVSPGKHKDDYVDAQWLSDQLRGGRFPAVWVMPPALRALRTVLRFRTFLDRKKVGFKNRLAALLMEQGIAYSRSRLHRRGYGAQLLSELDSELDPLLLEVLGHSRAVVQVLQRHGRELLAALESHPLIADRVARLRSVPGVGQITALVWVLEVGDPHRFGSASRVISYCGLCSARDVSAGRSRRGPVSKVRNHHLQWILVEAAKLAPIHNERLKALYERERQRGSRNRATLAVARKLATWLLALDKSGSRWNDGTEAA